jgi:hypothetical protein
LTITLNPPNWQLIWRRPGHQPHGIRTAGGQANVTTATVGEIRIVRGVKGTTGNDTTTCVLHTNRMVIT